MGRGILSPQEGACSAHRLPLIARALFLSERRLRRERLVSRGLENGIPVQSTPEVARLSPLVIASLAAGGVFPAILLGIFDRRMNAHGVIARMMGLAKHRRSRCTVNTV